MIKHYYAHVIYKNPGIFEYEYIIDTDDLLQFITDIYKVMDDHYYEIEGAEEVNMIDIGGWIDFIEENNIEYHWEDFFPYKFIWEYIKKRFQIILQDNEMKEEIKYSILTEVIQIYLSIVEDASFANGSYIFDIKVFKDSKRFANHFFSYLQNTMDIKYIMRKFKDRIVTINKFIKESNFPNSDYDEGVLNEWLNIYRIVYED